MANNFTSKNISSISLENIIYNLKSVPFHATAAEWELAPLNAYVPKQGEMVVYDKDENHDYIRIKIGDGINNLNGLDFYAGSWNDLKDKPFGETTVKSDTLTWDGNTEGLASVMMDEDAGFYHVSDATPTIDELKQGFVVDDWEYTTEDVEGYLKELVDMHGALIEDTFAIVYSDNITVDEFGLTFQKAGIYFVAGYGVHTQKLTIPGYNGFETTTIKLIETKYLPEHLQFGEETKVVEGDTLTWDGNTEGLVSTDDFSEILGTLYKISDAAPTLEDCISGATYTVAYDGKQENRSVGYDKIAEMSGFMGCLCIGDLTVLVAPENNFQIEVEGITAIFPEAGLYTAIGGDSILTSLTIPGYTGFVSEQTVVIPIDEKYLPESIATISYIDEAIAAIDIPDVSNFITESELNEVVGGLGSAAFTETTDYMLAGQVIDGGAW